MESTAPKKEAGFVLLIISISLATFMVGLDGTIVNIALPTIQGEMGLADDQRQWVMAGYSMTYGACLLVGGRLCDIIGLRRSFMIGLIGLGLTSLAVGLAPTPEFLIVARVLQGLSGALLSPSALSPSASACRTRTRRGRIKAMAPAAAPCRMLSG